MKITPITALYGLLLVLAAAGVALNSWVAAALFTVILGAYVFSKVFERIHPVKTPDPTGAELLQALEQHKREIQELVSGIKSKMTMPAQYGRRE